MLLTIGLKHTERSGVIAARAAFNSDFNEDFNT